MTVGAELKRKSVQNLTATEWQQVKDTGDFPKWISLNSVNYDNVQKWYGYQRYYLACNSYKTNGSKRKFISITASE